MIKAYCATLINVSTLPVSVPSPTDPPQETEISKLPMMSS